jgi:primosomal protein N'
MKKTYCRWKESEIITLFNFIEEKTKQGLPLTKAFLQYSLQAGRKANSVRNYYYAELDFLEKHKSQAQKLGIDLERHKKVTPQYFSDVESQKCVDSIDNLVKQGNSVRKACLILSNGDIGQMVRLQNKYRSLTKNSNVLKDEDEMPKNIISMPERNKHLTQHEIDGLFLGLLKLIKASAKQEAAQTFGKTAESANQELRKTLVMLAEKENQLKKIQANFSILQHENNKAKETIKKLRSVQGQGLIDENQKMQKLKKYSNKINESSKNLKINDEK